MKIEVIKKRFIAGAICPQCKEVDRIVVETGVPIENQGIDSQPPPDGHEMSRRRCVSCGYADDFAQQVAGSSVGVPRGRPEKPRVVTPEASVVRIIEPTRLSQIKPSQSDPEAGP